MRRQDREVHDEKEIDEVIRSASICRLGFCDEGEVYIVPLNFGYENTAGGRVFYFHGAKEGRKIELIQKNGKAGFELDTDYQPVSADLACGHSSKYRSVIGTGYINIVEDSEEKKRGMLSIMAHVTGKREWMLPESAMEDVAVLKMEVQQLSCKVHI